MKTCPCKEAKRKGKENPLYKHGLHGDFLYKKYRHIITTAQREDILICEEWSGENGLISFRNWFTSNIDGRDPDELSVIRKDKLLGYSPDNCILDKKNRKVVTVLGEQMTLGRAVDEFSDFSYDLVQSRVYSGWDVERALLTPEQPAGAKYQFFNKPLNYRERIKLAGFGRTKAKRERLIKKDLESMLGKFYGTLTPISIAYMTYNLESKHKRSRLLCRCNCLDDQIREEVLDAYLIRSGDITCCTECAKWSKPVNDRCRGLSGDRLWARIQAQIYRCTSTNSTSRKRYRDRGIQVCKEWLDDPIKAYDYILETFPDAYELMDKGMDIDRIDNNLHYMRGNIKFSTKIENMNNTEANKYLEAFNERLSTTMMVRSYANYDERQVATMTQRLDIGWDIHRALMCPIIKGRRKEIHYPLWNNSPSEEEKVAYVVWLKAKRAGLHNEVYFIFKGEE